jgi:hypothetical protein
MSQSWKLVGPDGKPYSSAVPGTLGGHRRTRIYGRLDCPAALRAIARGGYIPTVSSSSPKSTRVPPDTVPAPSASQRRTDAGKHSKTTDRGVDQFMQSDGDRL